MADVQGSIPIMTIELTMKQAQLLSSELDAKGFVWFKDYYLYVANMLSKNKLRFKFEVYNKKVIPMVKEFVVINCI